MLLQRIQGSVYGTLRTADSRGRRWILIHWMHYPRAALTPEDWKEQKAQDEEFVRSFHTRWSGFGATHADDERKARQFIDWHGLDFLVPSWSRDDPVEVLKDAVRRQTLHAVLERDEQRDSVAPRRLDAAPYELHAHYSAAPPSGYASPVSGEKTMQIAARGVNERAEAECYAAYEFDLDQCSFGRAMFQSPAYYAECKARAFARYQRCRGY